MSYNFVAASSQYLEVDASPVTAAPLTVSCWFRTTLTTSVDRVLTALANSGTTQDYFYLEQYAAEIYAASASAAGQSFAGSASTVTTNTWTHAGAVYASASSRVTYLNGTVGTPETTSRTPVGINRISVGRTGSSTPFGYHNGDIAEVAIWDVALSGADMTALAAGDSPMSLATEPVRYWRLKTDGDLTDLVGGAVLTANGATFSSANPTVDDPPAAPAGGSSLKSLLLGIG